MTHEERIRELQLRREEVNAAFDRVINQQLEILKAAKTTTENWNELMDNIHESGANNGQCDFKQYKIK